MNVKEAHFRRTAYKNGVLCGEVEVVTDHPVTPVVLAYFRGGQQPGFELEALVGNDADRDIDWYDNSFHQAFVELDVDTTSARTTEGAGGTFDRAAFARQVLAAGTVREDLERELTD